MAAAWKLSSLNRVKKVCVCPVPFARSQNASARWLGVLCGQDWEGAWGGLEMEAGSSSWETSLSLSQMTSLILDFGIWILQSLVRAATMLHACVIS